MSDKNSARRAEVRVFFDYADVTAEVAPDLTGLTYVDNEDGETDDLQITLQDRDGIWSRAWFGDLIAAAVHPPTGITEWIVTEPAGLTVRSGAGEKYAVLGTLPFGARVSTADVAIKWARIPFSGRDGYVIAKGLKKVMAEKSAGSAASAASAVTAETIEIGDEVTVTGCPQYTSYGDGTPGDWVENYTGRVTYLNLREGVPYPVAVGALGWFSLDQISGFGGETGDLGERHEGLKVQAVIVDKNRDADGVDRMLECGVFELDSLKVSGPPTTVTVKATSLPYTSTVRKVRKTRSWENYTLAGIAEEIAGKNAMSYMFLPNVNPYYRRVEQTDQADVAFLQKLCEDWGYKLKISNNIIVIFDLIKTDRPVLTITPQTPYEKMSLSTGRDTSYTSCRVSYCDPSAGLIEGVAYRDDYNEKSKNNEQLELHQKVSSAAEAERIAAEQLKKHNAFALKISFTFPGNTALQAGLPVKLTGFGTLDGGYVISRATHTVSGGYTTQIELREDVEVTKIWSESEP